MSEVTAEGYVLAALANSPTPAAMVETLSKVGDFDTLVVCWDDTGNDVIRAIVKRAIIAGQAHSLAGHGDGISKKLADKFGVSERHMDRMIRTYREIIAPRIERDGANATFLLEERMFYDVACEAAPVLKLPAVELLEQAEEKRAQDPKFTPSKWKRELGLSRDEGSTTSEGGKLIASKPEKSEVVEVVRQATFAAPEIRGIIADAFEEIAKRLRGVA